MSIRPLSPFSFVVVLVAVAGCFAGSVIVEDDFKREGETLGEGWRWVREDPQGWRLAEEGLEIRVGPGNMWGGDRNVANVLLRDAPQPQPGEQAVQTDVTVEHQPTEQYEQADLVWYYDDHNMVKIGPERVDGELSVVMGRMREGQIRTIAIIPLDEFEVRVRLVATADGLTGYFRTAEMDDWQKVGNCGLPTGDEPHISFQCYQGPADAVHWATFSDFRMRRVQRPAE